MKLWGHIARVAIKDKRHICGVLRQSAKVYANLGPLIPLVVRFTVLKLASKNKNRGTKWNPMLVVGDDRGAKEQLGGTATFIILHERCLI